MLTFRIGAVSNRGTEEASETFASFISELQKLLFKGCWIDLTLAIRTKFCRQCCHEGPAGIQK